jgi:methylmalonyl-CoA mutase cobalamin-binding domain/chain
MTDSSSLVQYISDLEAERALGYVKAELSKGVDPNAILTECRKGLEEVGKKFETCEYFVADLMYAAEMFEQMMEVLTPELRKRTQAESSMGKIVIATVKNDIHDIGKNLVATILRAGGFEVIDLGVDVTAEAIYQATQGEKPDIIALSCLLTNGLDSMEETIKGFATTGLREKVKIIVGGIPLSAKLAGQMGADAYGENANEALIRCKELMGGRT